MHPFILLLAAGCALLGGCARDGLRFTRGAGEIGPFVLQQALQRGAHPVSTNNLPAIRGEWRYAEDAYGVVFWLPRESFPEVQAFLRQAFGAPAHEPSETTAGGRLGWYAARTIGVGLQFGCDRERTQVIVLRPQPTREILKRIPEALELGN